MAEIKKSGLIGFTKAHIAVYDPDTMTYAAPVRLKEVQAAKVSVNMQNYMSYADDMLFEVLDILDNFEIELTFAALTPSEQATLLGWKKIGALKLSGAYDSPPWVAFMGQRAKINGETRYFKYLKGKASLSGEDMKTKGGAAAEQPETIKITFGPLPDDFPIAAFRNQAKILCDTDDPEYDGEGDLWYDSVIPGV